MGKASQTTMVNLTATTTVTATKKKGRPSRQDLLDRALLQQQQEQIQQSNHTSPNSESPHFFQNPNHPPRRTRSTRRSPIFSSEFVDGSDYDDDDDDERAEKKVKLVGRLPSTDRIHNSSSFHHSNCSDLDDINAVAEDEKGRKATDTQNGCQSISRTSMLAAGPTSSTAGAPTTTSLPDKKLLLLILDKLQKKDTRGVFAEPVDPEELPDYHEVIENPMDFGTVRKNLDGGLYSILEQLEADIYLICSNAMQYNAPSTIYFRQARSIQELARKEFETLRQDGGHSEPPPRPRRGRPPGSRNLKKLLESPSVERSVAESSPDAAPASRDDDAMRSNSYNLRKGPSLYRFPRNLDLCFDSPASASKSTSTKYVKKQYESEESRRETYNLFGQFDSGQDPSLLFTFETFENGLIPVGLDSNHSYARSLAQFAADLGPVVWSIVSKKIKSVLPPGVEFGPGWVGENKASSIQLSPPPEKADSILQDSCMSRPHYPSNSGLPNSTIVSKPSASGNENSLEARGLSSSSEWPSLKGINGVVGTGAPYQIQRDPVIHSGMNGFSGGFGTGLHIQEGVSRLTAVSFNHSQPPKLHPIESSSFEPSRNLSLSRMHSSPIDFHGSMNMENDPGTHGLPYWQSLSMQERWDNPNWAEPMVGFQASSSRSSRMPIGSPPQLDLVLQL